MINLSIITSLEEGLDKLFLAKQGQSMQGCVILPFTCVIRGNQNDCDEAYCTANNIKIVDIGYNGGTIVVPAGNIIFYDSGKGSYTRGIELMKTIGMWLVSMGLHVSYDSDSNDIMIDNKKVISMGSDNNSQYTLYGIQFGVNDASDLIKKICKKEQKKYPGNLKDFGVSVPGIIDFLQQNIEE